MPAPRSNGPNRCPQGELGVEENGTVPRWRGAILAVGTALRAGGFDGTDWFDGTYPPDLGSILAYEV